MEDAVLLFDKDGTLVEAIEGKYPTSGNQKLFLGVKEDLTLDKKNGFLLKVVSNQGGVQSGHKTLAECLGEMRELYRLLPMLDAIYFCTDYAGNDVYLVPKDGTIKKLDLKKQYQGKCRKPDPGMLLLASEGLKVGYYIGDRLEDEEAAKNANVIFYSASTWHENIKHHCIVI